MRRHQGRNGPGLTGTDLQGGNAVLCQQRPDTAGQSPVRIETIRPGKQGQCGVVLPHLRHQHWTLAIGHVRRIANDSVETRLDRVGPVARQKACAIVEAERTCIGARNRCGALGEIGTEAPRLRAFGQQGQQKTPRARSQVEHPVATVGFRQMVKRDGDKRLAIGPGVQRVRTEREGQAPKLPLAEDARDRLAVQTAHHHLRQTGGLISIQQMIARRENPAAIEPSGCLDQQARIDSALFYAGRHQSASRACKRFANGGDHAISASRAASSSAIKASMISSSASPLMILSIL